MPLIGALSSTTFFYSCYIVMLATCKPPLNRWKDSRTSKFYMSLTALTLAILIVFVSLMMTRSDRQSSVIDQNLWQHISCRHFHTYLEHFRAWLCMLRVVSGFSVIQSRCILLFLYIMQLYALSSKPLHSRGSAASGALHTNHFFFINRSDIVILGKLAENTTLFCGPFSNKSMTQSFSDWQNQEQERSRGFANFLEFILSSTVILPLVFVLVWVQTSLVQRLHQRSTIVQTTILVVFVLFSQSSAVF